MLSPLRRSSSSLFGAEGSQLRLPSYALRFGSNTESPDTAGCFTGGRGNSLREARHSCGRPAHTLPRGVGEGYDQLLGPSYHRGRSLPAVEVSSTSVPRHKGDSGPQSLGKEAQPPVRNPVVTGQSGRRGSPEGPGTCRVLLDIFPGTQKGRRVQTNLKSKRGQRLSSGSILQNGNLKVGHCIGAARGLALVNRPKRRVPSRPYAPRLQEIPQVFFRGGAIPVSGSPFRHFHSSEGVHETYANPSSGCQGTGQALPPVPGRLASQGVVSTLGFRHHSGLVGHSHQTGMDCQPEEVGPVPFSGSNLLGGEFRHSTRAGVALPGSRRQGPGGRSWRPPDSQPESGFNFWVTWPLPWTFVGARG